VVLSSHTSAHTNTKQQTTSSSIAMATATAAPAATITSVLGKPPGAPSLQDQYKIDKQLGKGSFGVVHLVRLLRGGGEGSRCQSRRSRARRRRSGGGRSSVWRRWPPLVVAKQTLLRTRYAGPKSKNKTNQAHGKAPPSEAVAVKSLSKARLVCPEDVADVKAEVAILEHVGDHDSVVGLKVGRGGGGVNEI
jgi:serine/threonine protein kinase